MVAMNNPPDSLAPAARPRPIYLAVALKPDLGGPLTYRLPAGMSAAVGCRVHVPLRGRGEVGFVVEQSPEPPTGFEPEKIKSIRGVIDRDPLIDAERLELGRWIAEYYQAPLGAVLAAMLPVDARTRRMYAWGPAGRPLELLGPALELWERLADEPLNRKALLDGLPKSAADELDRLVELGHLRCWDEAAAGPLRARENLAVRLTVGEIDLDGLRSTSPAQARLVSTLLTRGAADEAVWAAEACRLAETSHSTLRALERKGLAELFSLERREAVESGEARRHQLSDEQSLALEHIRRSLGSWDKFLLHGVTGSGKTEVYLRAVEEVLARGAGAVVLVPEIALTAQLARQFSARFGDELALLHSRQSRARRRGEWLRLFEGRARVALGPRSAVFAPLERLGLIIIDEEHDDAYKQAETPRYHAREVAARRCREAGCPMILGSATPSVWSAHLAAEGRLTTLRLTERVDAAAPPRVQLVDMRGRPAEELVPAELTTALEAEIAAGRQAIVLLNRRGYASSLQCAVCGYIPACPDCDLPLTYHRPANQLRCHHCGAAHPRLAVCQSCGKTGTLQSVGAGTQRVEQELNRLLPLARTVRLDSDAARSKAGHQRALARFAAGQADILLGTQMVAKGFHFPRVTIVGVLEADAGLAVPDFRAAERVFNLLTQVIGRAGRGLWPGRALVAARRPGHYAVDCALRGDYAGFLEAELEYRRRVLLPPFVRLASLVLSGENPQRVNKRAAELQALLAERLGGESSRRHRLLGPAPAPLQRLQGRWRRQLLLKTSRGGLLTTALDVAREYGRGLSSTHLTLDVDPVNLV